MPDEAGEPAEVCLSLLGLDADHRHLQPTAMRLDDGLHRHALLVHRIVDRARFRLAYMMLIQALRLHLADAASAGRGWLSALADKQMSIAIASMHSDPGTPWTLQSLAERVGASRSVFALRFRETVGATPMEYLARWRMLLAADRLKNSSDGLSAIAQSLGYESESAFGKAFRRVMGCSPRQYTRSTAPCAISVKQGAEDYEREPVVTG